MKLFAVQFDSDPEVRLAPLGRFSTCEGEFTLEASAASRLVGPARIACGHSALGAAGGAGAGGCALELRPDGLYATGLRWPCRAPGELARCLRATFEVEAESGRLLRLSALDAVDLPHPALVRALAPTRVEPALPGRALRAVLELTGANDPEEAVRTVASWREFSEEVDAMATLLLALGPRAVLSPAPDLTPQEARALRRRRGAGFGKR